MKKQILLSVLLLSFMINHAQTFTTPYSEDFDTVTVPNLPQYWTSLTTSPASDVYSTDNIANSNPNGIILKSGYQHTGSIMLISPRFTDIDEFKQIRFNIKKATNGETSFSVGTLTDPNDETTFHLLQNFPLNGDFALTYDWQEITIPFDNYNGTDQFIAIQHNSDQDSSLLFNLAIDDFVYESTATAGINDNDYFNLKVYPVPATNILNISNSKIIDNISVLSLLGKELYTFKPNNINYTININNLPVGKYFLKINLNKTFKYVFFIKK